jgi:hypothetical protein
MATRTSVDRSRQVVVRRAGGRHPVVAWSRPLTPLLIAGVVTLHLVLFLILFPQVPDDGGLRGFVDLSYQDSGRMLAGSMPYRDFLLEYPPGLLLWMILPRLFAAGRLAYRVPFFAEVALVDLGVLLTLVMSVRAARVSLPRVLGLYTLALVLLGPVAAFRLDLVPAALTALAVLAWQRDRPVLAAVALAAGAATKLYPLLLLPPLVAQQWARGWRRVCATVGAAALTLAVLAGPAFLAGPPGLLHSVHFQTGRHTEVEALWATLPLLLHVFWHLPLEVSNLGRAFVIIGPGDALGAAGTPVLLVACLVIYWRWWRGRSGHDPDESLLLGTAALVLSATILSKVLSPQYLLWALPPLALLPAGSWWTRTALCAFYSALPLTQWIFPDHFGDLVVLLAPQAVVVLALRNVLLLLAFAALMGSLWHQATGGRRQAAVDRACCRLSPVDSRGDDHGEAQRRS